MRREPRQARRRGVDLEEIGACRDRLGQHALDRVDAGGLTQSVGQHGGTAGTRIDESDGPAEPVEAEQLDQPFTIGNRYVASVRPTELVDPDQSFRGLPDR